MFSKGVSGPKPIFGGLIGESVSMRHLYDLIQRISQGSSSVLILGDTGTGKELVARAIHFSGPRRANPLIPVDCSVLPPSLVESELFGYVKGAFTGANHSTQGLLQSAHRGTVFLDEIGELPMYLQPKLLRALQEKEVRLIGSTERVPIDVRGYRRHKSRPRSRGSGGDISSRSVFPAKRHTDQTACTSFAQSRHPTAGRALFG